MLSTKWANSASTPKKKALAFATIGLQGINTLAADS